MSKKKKKKSGESGQGLSPAASRMLVTLVILLIVGGLIAFFGMRFAGRSAILAAHEPSLQTYLATAQTGQMPEAYLPGKVVTVDAELRSMDSTFLDLPGALRAEKPDEVGAVVFLNWQVRDTGLVIMSTRNPNAKTPLYEKTCAITVVDKARGLVTARGHVTNKINPNEHSVDDAYEGKPVSQVVAFLSNLPRK